MPTADDLQAEILRLYTLLQKLNIRDSKSPAIHARYDRLVAQIRVLTDQLKALDDNVS